MGTGTPAHVKIAFIGGGSRLWAPQLMTDLALSRSIAGEIELYDIDREAAGRNAALGKDIFGHRDARSRFVAAAVDNLTDALNGAHFVVLSIEPGPTRLRYADLEIPRSHGILQTVGDTTGPGGILRSLRAAPIFMNREENVVIYELRQYRVKKGKMKEWLRLMEGEIMPFQVSRGMAIPAMFTASKETGLFVWLRRFKNEAERKRLYRAVYETEHWKNVIQPKVEAVLYIPKIVVTDMEPTPKSVLQ